MSHVFEINKDKMEKLFKLLKESEFIESKAQQHEFFSLSKNKIRVTAYNSGKLLVQGKGHEEWIEFFLEPQINDLSFTYKNILSPNYSISRIGSDESGKGDIFGPLCVAAVFINKDIEESLNKNIKDSKLISDKKIGQLAIEIKQKCKYQLSVFEPKTYNSLYSKFNNLNKLLAWAHKQTIEKLIDKINPIVPEKIVIDKFASNDLFTNYINTNIYIEQKHKAESDVSVACASIIARDAFVSWLDKESKIIGYKLLPGASKSLNQCIYYLKQHLGNGKISELTKTHFKPVKEIMGDIINEKGFD